jgi:hypothetical protein
MGGDPLEAALMGGIPVGNVPIPFTGGQTLTGLTGGKVDFLLGDPNPVSVALRASLAGAASTIPGSGAFTGATPDFNPYINNIAAATAGTTVEAEEEQYNIDLANLAALYQQEEAPVTPVTQPEFEDITVDTTVEPIEQPELPLDVAPPVLPTNTTGGGGSSAPAPDSLEEEGPYFRITERNPDGSVVVIDLFGNISTLGADQFGTDSEGRPILAGETYSDDVPPEDRTSVITLPTDSSTPTDGVATDVATTGDSVTGDSGSGSGTGDGDGNGSGGGAGGGLGAGMLGGAAAAGGKPSVTELVFSDYTKRYEAPELQERVLPLQGYQAPQGLFRGLV